MRVRQASFASVLVCLNLASCHKHDHSEAEPEPHTAQVTVWENGLEAFVEYRYPVANIPVRFITHISSSSTGAPRREGPVVFEFTASGGQAFEHREERPARDGIYVPSITFPTSGAWRASLRVPTASGESRVVRLPALTVYDDSQAALRAAAPGEPEGISFLKEQQWKLSMVTETAATKTLSARGRFPGQVRAKIGRRVSVSSPVSGRLLTANGTAFPEPGRLVSEGEVLALIEPTLPSSELLTLAVRLAEAEADELRTAQALEFAEAALERATRLEKARAKSTRELEKARFEVRAATAAREAAVAIRARYESARRYTDAHSSRGESGVAGFGPLALKAPISGTVVHVDTAPGEHVTSSSTLFVILDSSVVEIEAGVPEYEATGLGSAPEAYLEIRGTGAGEARRLPLSLRYAGIEVDAKTRTVPLLYEADNAAGLLRVGMSVDVLVETAAPRQAVAVPESSLVDEDGKYVAFVQVAGETFEKRELTLGVRDSGLVEVIDGIAAGERVVTTDPWTIRLASLSSVIPAHGHEH